MSDVLEKWGQPVAERGFAQIPNYLLLLNQFLDEDRRLSPVDMLVLIQLVGIWWKKEEMPFPSMVTLAVRCGVSDRQIQRAVGKLIKHGLIERKTRRSDTGLRSNNAYNLQPLIEMLNRVAKAFPNAFPRNVSREKVKEISDNLTETAVETKTN
jgi:predicted transcriptional regulator